MTAHDHRSYVEGCYRCDLSRDEAGVSSDRTPAEALARARWDRELDPDHPWHVAWDDVSPRLRQEQVEFAEADIELLNAAGFRVTPEPDSAADRTPNELADALERAEQFLEAATPQVCRSCGGTGWVDDENWSPEDWEIRAGVERKEEAGLIPCGACSLGDWSTYRDERTEPTTVGVVLDRDETLALVADLAVLLRRQGEQLDTLRAAIGDPEQLRGWALHYRGGATLVPWLDGLAEAALAAAVPQDPERCACGKPATGTVGGVPTCGDDR